MRRILIAAALLLGPMAATLAAPVFDDPRALIEYVYAPYLNESDPFPDDPSEVYSPTLKQLWDEMSAKSEESEVPIIDFDPIINAQDYELTDFLVADPVIEADSATVVVSFSNFGEPQELHFELIRNSGGWLIDDIEAIGDTPWRFSELLAADPLLN